MLDRCNKHGAIGFWIRAPHMEGVKNHTITILVREGDRSNPNDTRHAPEGEDLAVRFIRRIGNSAHNVEPELYPDDGTTVRRIGMVVKKIEDLTPEDLEGSSPDTATPELIRYHLAMIANTELLPRDAVVTVWRIAYQPNAT